MVSCGEMKVGEVYGCDSCGFEMQVKKGCDCPTTDNCSPKDEHACCELQCCGKPMHLK